MQNVSNPERVSAKRFSVSMPPECEPEISELKKTQYFDKSKSELIRDLIRKGLEAEKKERDEQPE